MGGGGGGGGGGSGIHTRLWNFGCFFMYAMLSGLYSIWM